MTSVNIINPNFSSPSISNDSYIYYGTPSTPSTAITGWISYFGVLINNSTDWGYPTPYPNGSQAVSIQNVYRILQENISLNTNTNYTLSFYSCGRPGYGGGNTVRIDLTLGATTQTITTHTLPGPTWTLYTYPFTVSSNGLYTLSFNGTISLDRSNAYQGISITGISTFQPTVIAYKSAIISSNISCSGNISISGITNITGNISASGSITGGTLTTPNTFTVTDGANSGLIDQLSTELTLSSSGNRVAIASGNTLEFKNDSTSQYSAYTAREIIDDCALFTFLWNSQNPSSLRYALTSTFSINQQVPTTLALSTNIIYTYPVRLIKDQIANGAGFYLSVSGSPSITYALYNTANPGSLLATTAANTPTTGMNLVAFSSAYTVPTTGIYFICINASSVGTSLSTIAIATNTYMSYGISTMTNGVLNKAAQTCSSTGFPSTLSGLAMTLSTQVSYAIVYSLTASA